MAHCDSGQAATRIGISCPAQDTIDFRGSVQIPVRRHERPVIATVAAAPPIDRERAATASPLQWSAIQLFDLRGPPTAPSGALRLRNRRWQAPVRKVAPDEPASHARLSWLAFLSIFR